MNDLHQTIRQYRKIISSKRRVDRINDEIRIQKIKSNILKEEIESIELELAQKATIRKLFNRILLNEEAQHEQYRQDLLVKVLEYKEIEKVIELLSYERGLLESLISEKEATKNILIDLLKEPPDSISPVEKETIQLYNDNLKLLDEYVHLEYESNEALIIIRDIKAKFLSMISNINLAREYETWGRFYAEKQQAKSLKIAHIDMANEDSYVLKKLLFLLEDEIEDIVGMLSNESLFAEVKLLIKKFNINYYHSLIKDWVTDEQLQNTLTNSMQGSLVINKLEDSLKSILKKSEKDRKEVLQHNEELFQKIIKLVPEN